MVNKRSKAGLNTVKLHNYSVHFEYIETQHGIRKYVVDPEKTKVEKEEKMDCLAV